MTLTLDGYTLAPHLSQYAAYESKRTHVSGCTWTSGAAGANNAEGKHLTGDDVVATVAPHEETNPLTPGWSLADLHLAMTRLHVPFVIGTGGWSGLRASRTAGHYVVLQGDSDQFGNSTCSGAFDGDHCVGIHPANAGTAWWLDDPICSLGRWEEESVLHRYAAKLDPSIRYGVFLTPVPKAKPVGWRVTVPAQPHLSLYHVAGGVITGRDVHSSPGFEAACTAPASYRWPGGPSARKSLVQVTSGGAKGEYVEGRYARKETA